MSHFPPVKPVSASLRWQVRLAPAARSVVTSLLCTTMLITSAPFAAWAQQAPPPAVDAGAEEYTTGQLDALLAPIALYPDQLLTQVLMASSYPLQVVSATRWVESPENKGLSGDALENALAAQSWDPSVKSLVPFPQVLAMMNDKLDWFTLQIAHFGEGKKVRS